MPFLTVTLNSSAVTGRAGGCDKAAVIGAAIKDIYDVHKLTGLDDDRVQRS